MTRDGRFKRRVRARMRSTGENSLSALRAMRPQVRSTGGDAAGETRRDVRAWVELLSAPGRARDAYQRLAALPPDECRTAALLGLSHASWQVRRRCCRLLDHLALTDETIDAMTRLLQDPHPRVRQAALHTLACEGCKPEACGYDVRPVLEALRTSDPSADVRATAVGALWQFDDEAVAESARASARDDRSARVRATAEKLVRRYERKREAEARWLTLAPEVRGKLAKHAGKWVAVAAGTVIAADPNPGPVRRAVRGHRRPDAVVCWVPREDGSRSGNLLG